MIRIRHIIFILLILILFNVIGINAQDETIRFSNLPGDLNNKEWSSDGQRLAFQNPSLGEMWFVANPNTGELEEFDEYPFSADLTSAEEQSFPTEDVRRISPDGQLLLYNVSLGASAPPGRPYQFVLANRSTQQILDTNIMAIEVNINTLFDFLWSNNGLNVTTSNISFAGTRRINSIIIPESRNLENATVYPFDRVIIDNRSIYLGEALFNRLLAVSSTGQHILLTALEDAPNPNSEYGQSFLVMWNPVNESLSHLFPIGDTIPGLFETGTFSPLSEDQILVWQSEYSSFPGRLLFFASVNSEPIELEGIDERVFTPKFSPNGEWFSYSTRGELVFIRTEDLIPNDDE